MTLPELVTQLSTKLKSAEEEHRALHAELLPYTNRLVEGDELKKAQSIVEKIQESYNEIWPVLNFIGGHYKFAVDFAGFYNDWVKKLNEINNVGESTQEVTH